MKTQIKPPVINQEIQFCSTNVPFDTERAQGDLDTSPGC